MSVQEIHILIAEDLEENRFAIKRMLKKSEYKEKFTIANNGNEAWELLQENPKKYTVALLDRMMPGMSGMDLLLKMRKDERFSHIPVIFQTAMAQTEDIAEGLEAGAFYYVTKPYPERALFLSIIDSAVLEHQKFISIQSEVDDTYEALQMMDSFDLHFKTLDEEKLVTSFIAKACPDPKQVSYGITELLQNAVEHGNADITYDEKTELNANGNWKEEVSRRLDLPENKSKQVSVHFERKGKEIHIIIKDQGNGFDWQKYLELDPERAFDNHGRGIAMANLTSFDYIEYHGNGNEVHAFVNCNHYEST